MTLPGIGPVVTLPATIDVSCPVQELEGSRCRVPFDAAPTPVRRDRPDGSISKRGDAMMRTRLFDAAHVMLTRTIQWFWLKAWGMKIARASGNEGAVVTVARRMAMIITPYWQTASSSV